MPDSQNKRWTIAPSIPPEVNKALEEFHPVMRQVLYNRGKTTAKEAQAFLTAAPPSDTNPLLFLDMEKAVERIKSAIETKELMAIYGDYDVDGVTATALMTQVLGDLGGNVKPYIPNRFDEGYGLNVEALATLKEEGVGLVITVDCGIRSTGEARFAKEIGLDLIITDHHHPANEIPDALAVINAKRPGDLYPDKNLAGVGTAYKLASALIAELAEESFYEGSVTDIMDLVALGTVADLVPLDGENRALVRSGLERLRWPQRQGLVSLMGVAQIHPTTITAQNIGFGLGPRLNAAGRLDSAMAAYHLLTAKTVQESGPLAQQLDNQNRERQRMTRVVQEQAEAQAISSGSVPLLIFAASPDFNQGVLGLAASKLLESYYRPAIVAHQGEDVTRASCRSIREFHITEALDACADLLVQHGGHAAAAGFTVENHNLPALIGRLQALADEKLAGKDLRAQIQADAEVDINDLSFELLKDLEMLEPTGFGNPSPIFVTRGLRVNGTKAVGKDFSHLKMGVTNGKKNLDAIAFRQGHWYNKLPNRIDLIYSFEKNEYNGMISLQLNVIDIRPAE